MRVSSLLDANRIALHQPWKSKKKAFLKVSELLASSCPNLNPDNIFEGLLERERKGTTSLGHGIGLPHARMLDCEKPMIAILHLEEPVDYNSIDGTNVDIFCALIVPANENDDHVKTLANIAKLFDQAGFRNEVRKSSTRDMLIQQVSAYEAMEG